MSGDCTKTETGIKCRNPLQDTPRSYYIIYLPTRTKIVKEN